MADNTTLNSGSGGDVIASDDISGVKHQRIKIQYGADGSATDVSDSNPLPIDDAGGSLTVDDGGSSLTIDGTITANLSATDNAVLDSINTHVADTVSSLQDTGGTLLLKAEDTSATSGDHGVSVLGIRQDSDSSPVSADGDYQNFLFDSTGNLKVNIKAGAGSGGTASTDDAAFTAGSGSGTPAMGYYNSTPDLVDSGDSGVLAMTSARELQIVGSDGSGNPITPQVDDAAFTPATDLVSVVAGFCDETGTDSVDEGDAGALRMTARRALYTAFETPAGDSPWDDTNDALQVNVVAGGAAGGTSAADDADFTAGTTAGTPSMGVYESSPTSVTDGDIGILGITATRELRVEEANSTAILADTANIDTNITAILADTAAMDTNLSTLAGAVSGSEIQADLVGSIPAGTNNIGDVDVATVAAGTNLIGDVGLSGARTSGGTTFFHSDDLDETEEQIKGSAGQLYWLHVMNLSSGVLYLQVFNNTSASVTVGTTEPDMVFPIPTQGDTNGAGFALNVPNGIAFGTGITVAATTTATGSTGAGANEVFINAGYA